MTKNKQHEEAGEGNQPLTEIGALVLVHRGRRASDWKMEGRLTEYGRSLPEGTKLYAKVPAEPITKGES